MTLITRTEDCKKKFIEDFKKGLFSDDDGKVIKAWVYEMENFGPKYIQDSKDWDDHLLQREWVGCRASCFSKVGRIIYKVIDKETIEVCQIERITPDHNYKR